MRIHLPILGALVLTWASCVDAQTSTSTDPGPPGVHNVQVLQVSSTTAKISWTIVGPNETRSSVHYSTDSSEEVEVSEFVYGNGTLTVKLDGLVPSSTYTFIVIADYGPGTFLDGRSGPHEFHTGAKGALGAPTLSALALGFLLLTLTARCRR